MSELRYCPICPDFATDKQSTYSMHIIMKHRERKPHNCKYCLKSFAVKTQLQHHVTNIHTEPVIQCQHPNCHQTSKNNTAENVHHVKKHMHHVKMFNKLEDSNFVQCVTCEKVFKKNAVYYHVSKCHPLSPFHRNNVFRETYIPVFKQSHVEETENMALNVLEDEWLLMDTPSSDYLDELLSNFEE